MLKLLARELIRRNGLTNGFLYMQVTRGVAPRDHKFPKDARPALVMTTKQTTPHSEEMLSHGLKVITLPHREELVQIPINEQLIVELYSR